MTASAPRRIWLCADDYGISPGVNKAIRELITRGRLNATSVMILGPALARDDAESLVEVAGSSCAIGQHVTLTAPFHPLTLHFRPLSGGLFVPLSRLLRISLLRRLDIDIVHAEISAQLKAFRERFGRAPDFVDGHQHVQIFPQVSEAFVASVKAEAPQAWIRQCGRPGDLRWRGPGKALLLDWLSARFRRLASVGGLTFNPAFAGAYDFARRNDFAAVMAQALSGLPDGGLVMCHPGFVDETLRSLDPLTDQREREFAFLDGDEFPELLAQQQVALLSPVQDNRGAVSHTKI